MQTTIENTDKHTVKLTVEVPADEYEKEMDQTYRSIANSVKIPGFRKGKVPKQIIDAQIGRDVVRDEFLQAAVPDYYRQAVSEHDLAPITDPDIDLDDFADDSPLKFTAVVEVRPRLDFTEDDYTGLKIEKPPIEVSEADIDEWVDRLRERFAELEPAERPVQQGDFVTIDLKATGPLGQEIEGLSRTDYLYFVGSGEFGPSLDAELPGTKAGGIMKTTEEMGEGAGEGLAGQAAEMSVLVKDVKARILPEADDDLAKTASEFDTLAELRKDLRVRLLETKEREVKGELRDRALQALMDSVEVDLPDTLVDDETEHRVTHAKQRAEQNGLTIEQVLEAEGWDEVRLREDSRDHAIRAIKSDLVLEGVARAADIQVDADELGKEISVLAQAYDRDPKELATQLDRSGQIVTLAGDIIRGKALDLLVDRADVIEEAPSSETTADTTDDTEATEATTEEEPDDE
jgi:trigger factor